MQENKNVNNILVATTLVSCSEKLLKKASEIIKQIGSKQTPVDAAIKNLEKYKALIGNEVYGSVDQYGVDMALLFHQISSFKGKEYFNMIKILSGVAEGRFAAMPGEDLIKIMEIMKNSSDSIVSKIGLDFFNNQNIKK